MVDLCDTFAGFEGCVISTVPNKAGACVNRKCCRHTLHAEKAANSATSLKLEQCIKNTLKLDLPQGQYVFDSPGLCQIFCPQ